MANTTAPNFNIKDKIGEITAKLQKDPALMATFQKEPIKAVEKLLGVDLPDEIIQQLINGVKAKLAGDKVGDALGALKKLF